MYSIPTDTPSRDFALCWQSAGLHLETLAEKAARILSLELLMLPPGHEDHACIWLKNELRPPFLEHLSFRLGNQLFFIRIEDMENRLDVPGTRHGLQRIADACMGHACLMPMLKRSGQWVPASSDWGLVSIPETKVLPPHPDAYGLHIALRHGLPINPPSLVTSEKIEMTDWELQDFAVQIVRNNLPADKVMSWNVDPDVAPSLWFVGDQGPEWAIIKAVRYPANDASLPHNVDQIARSCSPLSRRGNFAVVSMAAAGDTFEPLPLYRGHEMLVSYQGMRKLAI